MGEMATAATAPDWPALMDEPTGRAYFGGVGSDLFHAILAQARVAAVELPRKRTMWRRKDLDRALDSLQARGLTPTDTQITVGIDPAVIAMDRVRRRAGR